MKILSKGQILPMHLEQLASSVLSSSLHAPAHIFYCKHFNPVDIADGYWYATEEKHAKQCWQTKMILAITRFAVINAWVASTGTVWSQMINWRKMVAKQLMHY